MAYSHEITLDLNVHSPFTIVQVKQYDANSRQLTVHVKRDGLEFNLLENGINLVALRVAKPNGGSELITKTINNNDNGSVDILLTDGCLEAPGRAYCDVALYSDGKLISTMPFIMEIVASPNLNYKALTATDEFIALNEVLESTSELIAAARGWAVGPNSTEETPSDTNNAKYYYEQASTLKDECLDMLNNMRFEAVATDSSQPEIVKTGSSPLKFQISIPKSDAAFVTFDVDYSTGQLIMYRPDAGSLRDEVDFEVDAESGQLKIGFNTEVS